VLFISGMSKLVLKPWWCMG